MYLLKGENTLKLGLFKPSQDQNWHVVMKDKHIVDSAINSIMDSIGAHVQQIIYWPSQNDKNYGVVDISNVSAYMFIET